MIVAMGYEMGINPEWLLTGEGEIYRNSEENIPENSTYLFANRKIKELKTTALNHLEYVHKNGDLQEVQLYLTAIKSDADQILTFLNTKLNG